VPRLTAIRALALGAAIAALAQLALPVGMALYDGVTPLEPYRYLSPQPGQVGTPTSYGGDVMATNGTLPQVIAATTENPPQAQLIAVEGVFVVPAGVTTAHVSITAVAPPALPDRGAISGNVYRIAVTDPSGAELAIASGQRPTLAMRSAGALSDATIYRYADGRWQAVETVSNSSLGVYQAQPTSLGDFAVVDRAAGGIPITSLVIGATVALVIGVIAIWGIRTWGRRKALEAKALEAETAASRRRRNASGRRQPPKGGQGR
jgi:hypothetical protein